MRKASNCIIALLVALIFSLSILEIVCQLYFKFVLVEKWNSMKASEFHYFHKSDDPLLSYELLADYHLEKDAKELWINKYGIRDRDEKTDYSCKLAVIGDSVPFGVGLSQEETISSLLNARGTFPVKVLNFAVPGYEISEIYRFLTIKNEIYDVEHIIYILNLNDFARRDSIYEGADKGLYRMYKHSVFKSPIFIRRVFSRFYQQGKPTSTSWYKWLFNANKEWGLGIIEQMESYAEEKKAKFTVVLFPPRVAFQDDFYELQDVFSELVAFLKEKKIAYINPLQEMRLDVASSIDVTDHLTPEGAMKMADIIWDHLHPLCSEAKVKKEME